MKKVWRLVLVASLLAEGAGAQRPKAPAFRPVPELGFRAFADGRFLKEWKGIGYPYGLVITPDQHVWMADGGYDRIVELDTDGKILGAIGEPGHRPGQFAWAHFLAVGPDRRIYVADVLNWRFQVFAPTAPTGRMARYVPSKRMFWDSIPSTGWFSRQTHLPKK